MVQLGPPGQSSCEGAGGQGGDLEGHALFRFILPFSPLSGRRTLPLGYNATRVLCGLGKNHSIKGWKQVGGCTRAHRTPS